MEDIKLLKKFITTSFRLNGLSIKGDACEYLCKQLFPVAVDTRETWLSRITEYLQKKQTFTEPIVEIHHVTAAVQECCKSELNLCDDIIQVISSFEVPKFSYCIDSKKFVKSTECPKLFDSASQKVALFHKRYLIIKQRLDRHDLLTKISNYNESGVKLNYIDHLLSVTSEELEVIVLGLLSQLKEGRYYLEDPTGIIPLNLTNATYHPGFFTENCFVLAEGIFSDGILKVQGLAHPPAELSRVSRLYYGASNTFGGNSETSLKNSSRMIKYEQENDEAMIVFLSDIYLNQAKTMEKLKQLFSGFDEDTPALIVLMGNFLSVPKNQDHFELLRKKFKELADILSTYENLLKETLFVIIPGPGDTPAAPILPSPPLPKAISDDFTKKVPKTIFGTNPCRIQYCTQEIVVLREDVLSKMCRNCVHFPGIENIPGAFTRTILSQSHLAPLPLSVCPIYWSFDECLHLYPLPDVVVIADQMESFTETYKETTVMNPGSFSRRKFIFKVYLPGKRQMEDSQIPDT